MQDDPNLDAAYSLKTPEDSRRLYAAWADSYDSGFVNETGYMLHRAVAEAFVAAGGQGPVLDVGAGTGGCGAVLRALGVDDVHATDISPEMLRVADEKGIYTRSFAGDILEGLPADPASYAGIVSAGTFTLGHVGPEGLDEVMRLLAPGGLAVISVRDAHYKQAGFANKIKQLAPLLAKTSDTLTEIYENPDPAHADDKALLLHLWKS